VDSTKPEGRLSNLVAQRRARWLLAHIDDLILETGPTGAADRERERARSWQAEAPAPQSSRILALREEVLCMQDDCLRRPLGFAAGAGAQQINIKMARWPPRGLGVDLRSLFDFSINREKPVD